MVLIRRGARVHRVGRHGVHHALQRFRPAATVGHRSSGDVARRSTAYADGHHSGVRSGTYRIEASAVCFSAEADFASAAVIGAIGVATLTKVRAPREIPLAVMPLAFAAHQLV